MDDIDSVSLIQSEHPLAKLGQPKQEWRCTPDDKLVMIAYVLRQPQYCNRP
jgi:hypothetical protein